MKRIFAFCGKGGVGKSTLSVHMAQACSELGKTAIVALDQQFNICDVVADCRYDIHTQLMDSQKVTEMVDFLIDNTFAKNFKEYAPAVAPDMITMCSLAEAFHTMPEDVEYVVLDFPPNHAALTMLNLPDVLDNATGRVLLIRRRVRKMITGEDKVLDQLQYLNDIVHELRDTMHDKKTTFCVLGVPTHLGVIETDRMTRFLINNGYHPDYIIANMVPLYSKEYYGCSTCADFAREGDKWLGKMKELAMTYTALLRTVPRTLDDTEILDAMRSIAKKEC